MIAIKFFFLNNIDCDDLSTRYSYFGCLAYIIEFFGTFQCEMYKTEMFVSKNFDYGLESLKENQ